jgi:glycerol-3-phosphate O-acyltransferase/dihydroxyacetone phosphate acyltransferase
MAAGKVSLRSNRPELRCVSLSKYITDTRMKRLIAAWRLLVGVWIPKSFEMSFPSFIAKSTQFAPDPPKVAGLPPQTEPEKYVRPPRLPSRVLVRHVLRTRIEAARELASVLLELESEDAQVNASFWLAERHGGEVIKRSQGDKDEGITEWERPLAKGLRGGAEVVEYLREKGARLGPGGPGGRGLGRTESHWAARSDDEGFRSGGSEPE